MHKILLAMGLCTLGSYAAVNPQINLFLKMQENAQGIPAELLRAVSHVESGRYLGGAMNPWPWTINVEGRGYVFKTKQEAIKAVEKFQHKGAKSIDVGVMQINLKHHPHAFRNLEEAFDPQLNIAYGAKFLKQLFAQHKSWNAAIGHYHSACPKFHNIYKQKVLSRWMNLSKNKNVDAPQLQRAVMKFDEIPTRKVAPGKKNIIPYATVKRVYYPLDNARGASRPPTEERTSYPLENHTSRQYYALD